MVKVMKIMETSFKRSHACTAIVSAPNPKAGHHRPTPPLEAPEHSQASLGQSLWGHCSFLLGPGTHKVRSLQESIFQSCVRSSSSIAGLMVTSSKRAYAVPISCTQSPCPCGSPLLTSTGDAQTQLCLSLCGVPGSWYPQGLFEPAARPGTAQPAMKD